VNAPDREPPKRAIALAVAVAVTAVMLLLALYLGDWARRTRSHLLHQGRLERLLEKKPHEGQVVAALEQEGMRGVAMARTETELDDAAQRWGGSAREVVRAEGRRSARTRVFLKDDLVYFVYFDEPGVMRAFTVATVSR